MRFNRPTLTYVYGNNKIYSLGEEGYKKKFNHLFTSLISHNNESHLSHSLLTSLILFLHLISGRDR